MSAINICLQLTQAVLPILSLYLLKTLIETVVSPYKDFDYILSLIIAFGLLQLLIAAVGQYAAYIGNIQQHTLTDNLSNLVLRKAVEVDYEYYENPTYHDTLHLAQQQAVYKVSQFFNSFNSLLLNMLSLLFLVAFFLTLKSLFALSFIIFSIPLAVIKWYSGFKLLQLEKQFTPMEREASYIHQTLTGINSAKEVRVLGFGLNFIEKYQQIRNLIRNEKTKLNAKMTKYSLIAETSEIIVMMIIFSYLAWSTSQKTITIGAFVIYIQGFHRLQGTSKSFLQAFVQIFQQRLFLKDLFSFLDLKTKKSEVHQKPFPSTHQGLQVKNVSFTYPDSKRLILDNISLNCRPGKIIAIVGENGSGKSTLVKLLARLYSYNSGSIKIEDIDIAEIDEPNYRKKTVFLFQDFEKYFLTIEENITLGDFNADKDFLKIETAAKRSDAHNFIEKLSKKYKTRIGRLFKGSEQLSGGQWQKLALSRVFYRNTQLVILDEPTSALDPNAEFEIFENVKKHLKEQMVILITHRLYNLKIADYIYVLKDGKVEQEGIFADLAKGDGEFKRMYENQKL